MAVEPDLRLIKCIDQLSDVATAPIMDQHTLVQILVMISDAKCYNVKPFIQASLLSKTRWPSLHKADLVLLTKD
jgi:hypothetical protein